MKQNKRTITNMVVTFHPIHDFDDIKDTQTREAKKTELMIRECSRVIKEKTEYKDTKAMMDNALFWIMVIVFFCLLSFLSNGINV